MRRQLLFLVTGILIAVASVAGVFALRAHATGPDQSTNDSSLLGPAPANLDAQMNSAAAAGPNSITCDPGYGVNLVCTQVSDGSVIAALKRGDVVYGRTVIGFPSGANLQNERPTFESSDLVCRNGSADGLDCTTAGTMQPTVASGTGALAFYKRYDVTFTPEGRVIGHASAPTIPLRVTPIG